jgi:hypothetical protein
MTIDERLRRGAEAARQSVSEMRPPELDTISRGLFVHRVIASIAAASVAVLMVAGALLIIPGDGPGSEAPPQVSTAPSPSVPGTSVPAAATSEPTTTINPAGLAALGDGWEVVAERPAGIRFVGGVSHAPGFGYVLTDGFPPGVIALSSDGIEWRATDFDAMLPGESVSVTGVARGDSGLIAFGERCASPEESCVPAIWVSVDGITWDSIEDDSLFMGCREVAGECHVSLYGSAVTPDGHVVVLGIDPAVECGDGCYDITNVAWSSTDGSQWERHEIDVEALLPEGWLGMYNVQHPLAYTGTRWLTFVTLMNEPTGTVFLESEDGARWSVVDTGNTFDGRAVEYIAIGERGIVVHDFWSVWFSPDGFEWVLGDLAGGPLGSVAALDDGFMVTGTNRTTGEITSIWYSPSGTTWTDMPVHLEGAVQWNGVASNGTNLLAIGIFDNRSTVWRWLGGVE